MTLFVEKCKLPGPGLDDVRNAAERDNESQSPSQCADVLQEIGRAGPPDQVRQEQDTKDGRCQSDALRLRNLDTGQAPNEWLVPEWPSKG